VITDQVLDAALVCLAVISLVLIATLVAVILTGRGGIDK